jgi:hypothetical protein
MKSSGTGSAQETRYRADVSSTIRGFSSTSDTREMSARLKMTSQDTSRRLLRRPEPRPAYDCLPAAPIPLRLRANVQLSAPWEQSHCVYDANVRYREFLRKHSTHRGLIVQLAVNSCRETEAGSATDITSRNKTSVPLVIRRRLKQNPASQEPRWQRGFYVTNDHRQILSVGINEGTIKTIGSISGGVRVNRSSDAAPTSSPAPPKSSPRGASASPKTP